METLLKVSKLDTLKRKLGFQNCFAVDLVGRSGGIALLWTEGVQLEVCNYSLRHISGWIEDPKLSKRWLLTGFWSS